MEVAGGRLRIVSDDSPAGSLTTVDPEALRPLHGMGREALMRALDHPGAATDGVADGLLISCSCGHMYLAEH